jgi:hypothetical protein
VSSKPASVSPSVVFRYWLPLAIWLGVIVLESTSMASAANTGMILRTLLQWLPRQLGTGCFDLIHFALRKGGHFLGYGILGLLFFRALHATLRAGVGRMAAYSVGLTLVVASLDEFHQSFIPSRTGCVRDVLLDTVGAACLLSIALVYFRFRVRARSLEA